MPARPILALATLALLPTLAAAQDMLYNQPFVVRIGATSSTLDEKFRITPEGNVSIGVNHTSPLPLTVNSPLANSEAARFGNAVGGRGDTQGKTYLGLTPWTPGLENNTVYPSTRIGVEEDGTASYNASLVFQTRNTDSDTIPLTRMVILSNGNVGIGLTAPSATLDVNGYLKLKTNTAAPITCNSTLKGALAFTSATRLCLCDGTSWKEANSATACTW